MEILFCGVRGSTSAPGADFVRVGGHTSCVALTRSGEDTPSLVLDAGTGLQGLTDRLGGAPFRGTLLLTHLHWDHSQGLPFFRSAWRSLKARRANMDVPISIGVLLTRAISFSETVLGGRDAYFDASVSLLFLLLIGRWLERRLRARASSAAADLLALQAPTATVLGPDGALLAKPVAEIRPGELLLLRAGERVPVDCRVLSGASELDNSLLTGETKLIPPVPTNVDSSGPGPTVVEAPVVVPPGGELDEVTGTPQLQDPITGERV